VTIRLVHYAKSPVLAVRSVEQPGPADMKPRGFWLSDDDCEDNWRAWCEAETFSLGNLACVHDVALRDTANVLRLAGAYEIDAFDRQYTGELCRGISYIDWARVASDYDGIIITPYIWERRLTNTARWYYGWDCASGCIWNADAIASITLRAQAGEARRAETPLGGSVHEHAVPEGDAP
jgi:hypothetical protein